MILIFNRSLRYGGWHNGSIEKLVAPEEFVAQIPIARPTSLDYRRQVYGSGEISHSQGELALALDKLRLRKVRTIAG
jgi:hypothetical protein